MQSVFDNIFERLLELERRQVGLFTMGKVSKLGDSGTEASVVLPEGIETGFLPVLVHKAGNNSKEIQRLEVGEQVVVASPTGDLKRGFILGSLFTTATNPQSSVSSLTQLNQGVQVRFDSSTNTYTVDYGEARGVIVVNAPNASVAVNAQRVEVDSNSNVLVKAAGAAKLEAGGEVQVKAKSIKLQAGGALKGVVTGSSKCAFTGAPHPDMSATVEASN